MSAKAASVRELLEVALGAADIAHTVVTAAGQATPEVIKSPNDFATNVDIEVEAAVRRFLEEESALAVQGEEGSSGEGAADRWAVDPIDGTFNFAFGVPLWGFSIAALVDGSPVVGVIDCNLASERFMCAAGEGVWLAGEPVHVTKAYLRESAVMVGDFTTKAAPTWPNDVRAQLIGSMGAMAGRVRMIGTAATDLAWVAAGRAAASVVFSNNAWDVAAGVLMVREAGGIVLDLHGSEWTVASDSVLAAASEAVAEDVLSALRPA